MRFRDKATSNGSCHRASKPTSGENTDGIRPGDGIPQVCEGSTYNCKGRRGEEATEEATDADGCNVLGKSDWDLEDGKECEAKHQGSLSTQNLRHRAKSDGPKYETLQSRVSCQSADSGEGP
jgi:hypothetical protein